MTCYLKDRDQPNAVDGGLCVPDNVNNVTEFCSIFSGSPSSLLVPTIYEVHQKHEH
jgi:hypothetical protein